MSTYAMPLKANHFTFPVPSIKKVFVHSKKVPCFQLLDGESSASATRLSFRCSIGQNCVVEFQNIRRKMSKWEECNGGGRGTDKREKGKRDRQC